MLHKASQIWQNTGLKKATWQFQILFVVVVVVGGVREEIAQVSGTKETVCSVLWRG